MVAMEDVNYEERDNSDDKISSDGSSKDEERSDEDYTVLGVKISHGHDYTSCATLGHFEMEF